MNRDLRRILLVPLSACLLSSANLALAAAQQGRAPTISQEGFDSRQSEQQPQVQRRPTLTDAERLRALERLEQLERLEALERQERDRDRDRRSRMMEQRAMETPRPPSSADKDAVGTAAGGEREGVRDPCLTRPEMPHCKGPL